MLKKVVTYTDYNDIERTETLWFNLSKAELIDMQMTDEGDLGENLQKIIDEKNKTELYKKFKDIILRVYGEKSEDGKRFVKSQKIRDDFEQSAAFDAFFMELFTDAKAAAEFVNKILPKDLAKETVAIAASTT